MDSARGMEARAGGQGGCRGCARRQARGAGCQGGGAGSCAGAAHVKCAHFIRCMCFSAPSSACYQRHRGTYSCAGPCRASTAIGALTPTMAMGLGASGQSVATSMAATVDPILALRHRAGSTSGAANPGSAGAADRPQRQVPVRHEGESSPATASASQSSRCCLREETLSPRSPASCAGAYHVG